MSTKHIDTVADLVRFGASVKIECAGCGFQDAQRARNSEGLRTMKFEGDRPRLKCARCGAKEARLIILPPL